MVGVKALEVVGDGTRLDCPPRRTLSLGIDDGMHPEHTDARKVLLRRRPANLVQVALVPSYSVRRSSCKDGGIVIQDWCPTFSIAGGGEVRFLAGSDATAEQLRAAAASSAAPNGLLPVRFGHAAYVARGGTDGAAGALKGYCWCWLASCPSE